MTIKESSIHNKVSNYGYIIAAISLFCYCLHWWLCIVSAVCNWKGVTVLGNREFTSKYLGIHIKIFAEIELMTPPQKKFYIMKKVDCIIFAWRLIYGWWHQKRIAWYSEKKMETVSSPRLIYIPFLNLIAGCAISPAIMIY